MGKVDLFAIGASSGGLEVLRRIAAGLPDGFPAAICVVVHISPDRPGLLSEILSRAGSLPAIHPDDGEEIRTGRIYVAPPDRHLLVTDGRRLRLGYGPKENRFRPAVDPLFRSAATTFGSRAAGVILSGGLDDGTAGLAAIKLAGGIAIVQDPTEPIAPSMPSSAKRFVAVDHCLRSETLPDCLMQLALGGSEPPCRPAGECRGSAVVRRQGLAGAAGTVAAHGRAGACQGRRRHSRRARGFGRPPGATCAGCERRAGGRQIS